MLPVIDFVIPAVSSNVPAFLAKLWKMVDDPETAHLISWGEENNSFVIHNQADFAQKLLPYYYKHSNMASFVRQLNMYGFHKVLGIDSGGLKSEKADQMEFAHPYFLKGQGHLLDQIKRKISSSKAVSHFGPGYSSNIKSEYVTEVMNEVTQIKDKQEDFEGKMESMKKENEALWREVVNLRQKHQAQQKIVNKLIQFLVSFVQPRMGGAVKRRHNPPLAIEGESQSPSSSKIPKMPASSETMSGPTIKELNAGDPFMIGSPSTVIIEDPPFSPMQGVDPTLVNPSIQIQKAPEKKSRPNLNRELSKEEFETDTFSVQKDLDNLKDFMSGQVTLDTSLISNIFNPDEPLFSFVPPVTTPPENINSSLDDILKTISSPGKSGKLSLACDTKNEEFPELHTPAAYTEDDDDQNETLLKSFIKKERN